MKTNKPWLFAMLLLLCTSAKAQQDGLTAIADNPDQTTKIATLSAALAESEKMVASHQSSITILQAELAHEKSALLHEQHRDDEISVAGIAMPASQYSSALTFLCGFLLLVGMVFVVKFRNANYITVKATEALANLEEEHEEHVRISLEREQKLRRQLQDEINRHKISHAS